MKIKTAFFLSIIVPLALGKVSPPNYNFSLDKLQVFYPGNSLEDIQKSYGKGELYSQGGDNPIYRFRVTHARYRFPVFVQFDKGLATAFWASLPTYFLHDVFHQSLINRYGKQDRYVKRENSALYIWNEQSGATLVYSGQCTITCFPAYFGGIGRNVGAQAEGLLEKFHRQFIDN